MQICALETGDALDAMLGPYGAEMALASAFLSRVFHVAEDHVFARNENCRPGPGGWSARSRKRMCVGFREEMWTSSPDRP